MRMSTKFAAVAVALAAGLGISSTAAFAWSDDASREAEWKKEKAMLDAEVAAAQARYQKRLDAWDAHWANVAKVRAAEEAAEAKDRW